MKKEKKIWWLLLEKRVFATILRSSTQMESSFGSWLDTVARSSYTSAALISFIGTSPVRRETRQIKMLLRTKSRKIKEHNLTMSNQERFFKLNVNRAEKDILLTVVNPEHKTLLQSYSYLKRGVYWWRWYQGQITSQNCSWSKQLLRDQDQHDS